jgi:hypothetical protein
MKVRITWTSSCIIKGGSTGDLTDYDEQLNLATFMVGKLEDVVKIISSRKIKPMKCVPAAPGLPT